MDELYESKMLVEGMRSALMPTYGDYGVVVKRAEGCRLFDIDDNVYLDFLSGVSVVSLGHSNEAVNQAVVEQISNFGHLSNFFLNETTSRLAHRIASFVSSDVSDKGKVFFSNSGAEANETAIKLVRRFGGGQRYKIVTCLNSFHGRTMGALAATGQPGKQKPFQPLPPGFVYVEFDNLAQMREAISDPSVAAVMVEIIQGEGGVVDASPGYFEEVERLCKERGILLVVDEVQTGMGRTGRMFAFSHFGLDPDIVTLSKALGNGFPIGATWARTEVANAFIPGDHGSTFGGSPSSCAAALAVFDEIERRDLLRHVVEVSTYLRGKLSELDIVHAVSGMGLLLGLRLKRPVAKEIVTRSLQNGLVLNALSDQILRIAPPLVVSKNEIDEALAVLSKVSSDL